MQRYIFSYSFENLKKIFINRNFMKSYTKLVIKITDKFISQFIVILVSY